MGGGYMPKGGARKAQQLNARWEAGQVDAPAPAPAVAVSAVAPDASGDARQRGVRVSAASDATTAVLARVGAFAGSAALAVELVRIAVR